MACGAGTADAESNNGWCLDGAALGLLVDSREMPNARTQLSVAFVIISERSCATVGGGRNLRATGYGDVFGTVRNDRRVRIHPDLPNVLVAPKL